MRIREVAIASTYASARSLGESMRSAIGSGWIERRDPRVKVVMKVRMRAGAKQMDACIRDVSRRGLLVQADAPPGRGAVIEINGEFPPIIGRVMWTNGRRFGVQTQDRIDIAALITGRLDRGMVDINPNPGRRAKDQQTGRLISSAHVSRLAQYVAVILIGGCLAVALAHAAYAQLSYVARSVESALE